MTICHSPQLGPVYPEIASRIPNMTQYPHRPFTRVTSVKLKKNGYSREDLIKHAIARDGDECWFCGGEFFHPIPYLRRTLEHFVAVSNGGLDEPETTCIAHSWCNSQAASKNYLNKVALRDRLRSDPPVVLISIANQIEKEIRKVRFRIKNQSDASTQEELATKYQNKLFRLHKSLRAVEALNAR